MYEKLGEMLGEKVHNTDEAAAVLGVCVAHVRRLIREGKIKASLVGRRHLITESSIKDFFKNGRAAA